jgi:hypothetical protein
LQVYEVDISSSRRNSYFGGVVQQRKQHQKASEILIDMGFNRKRSGKGGSTKVANETRNKTKRRGH